MAASVAEQLRELIEHACLRNEARQEYAQAAPMEAIPHCLRFRPLHIQLVVEPNRPDSWHSAAISLSELGAEPGELALGHLVSIHLVRVCLDKWIFRRDCERRSCRRKNFSITALAISHLQCGITPSANRVIDCLTMAGSISPPWLK